MTSYSKKHVGLTIVSILVVFSSYQYLDAVFLWSYTPKTVYSSKYNESSFNKITVGMTAEEAIRLAGQPIRRFTTDNIVFLVYSDIGDYTTKKEKAYRQRWVATGRGGRVVYVFKRTITTDHNPTSPVGKWVRGVDGVHKASITDEYKNK